MVDVVGDLRCERTERVVRQRREVDDGVETGEVLDPHIADVDGHAGRILRCRTEGAFGEQACVEADDLVTAGEQFGHHDGSEITLMACDEYAHVNLSRDRRQS